MSQTRRAKKVSRETERAFWVEIKAGRETVEAARVAGISRWWGEELFGQAGGVCPRTVAPSSRSLSLLEREQILIGITRGHSIRQIAKGLGRAPSTVWRELRRNRGRGALYRPRQRKGPVPTQPGYSPSRAHSWAQKRLARPKRSKFQQSSRLAFLVEARLTLGHSPRQIMQRLRMDFPDQPDMWVSHETIYRSIYVQGRGELRKELAACLRSGRAVRIPKERAKARALRSGGPGKIPGMVMISERPAEVNDRAVPGHWEGDLIVGANNRSQIGTLVERATRFVMLLHLPDRRDAVTVGNEMVRQMGSLPDHLRLSVTWDQGKEMADHARIKKDLDLRDGVFFCDPHSPWQRGSNENTNGLLRQYFPKGTDLSGYTRAYLDVVAGELNGRPRQTLGWRTPAEALAKLLEDQEPNTGVAPTP